MRVMGRIAQAWRAGVGVLSVAAILLSSDRPLAADGIPIAQPVTGPRLETRSRPPIPLTASTPAPFVETEAVSTVDDTPPSGSVIVQETILMPMTDAAVGAKAADLKDADKDGEKPDEKKKESTEKKDEKKEEKKEEKKDEKKEKKWYDKYSIRGYGQLRYNRLLETDEDIRHPQDRSVGDDRGFFIRRARLVLSGDVSDWLSIYIQPDFASDASDDRIHFLQVRDWYADVFLDCNKEHRIRAGQSKIPYGFENLQSSQNRLTLDRADALNSGAPNERDLGLMYYWAPAEVRERFRMLVQDGLKGSGDYGVIGLGVYNGQSANRPERNENKHIVGRITYPFLFSNGQIFEPGFQAYRGTYVVNTSGNVRGGDFEDHRAAWSFTLYPQPLGLQGEYTVGVGPELSPDRTFVQKGDLHGGYLMLFYRQELCRLGTVIPYSKIQYYRGGNKGVTNAPRQQVDEWETGVEWSPFKALELTVAYSLMDRTSTEFPYPNVDSGLLRLQLQWNY